MGKATHRRILTSVDDGILGDYTIFSGVGLDDFELYSSHPTTNKEGIALANGSIR